MKDLIISINANTRKASTSKGFVGINGEHLNGNIVVDFIGEFIDGAGFLEIDNGENKYIIGMTKDGEHYTVPIRSSLLTKTTKLKLQFRAHIAIDQDTTRIFKSEIIELPVLEAINAVSTIPDDYPAVWVSSIGGETGDILIGDGLTIENKTLKATGSGIQPSIFTAKGSLISSSEAGTPTEIAKGTAGQVLTIENDMPAWKTPQTPTVKAGDVDSESATAGQVLQADGNGGASWQNASGGGAELIWSGAISLSYTGSQKSIPSAIQNATSGIYLFHFQLTMDDQISLTFTYAGGQEQKLLITFSRTNTIYTACITMTYNKINVGSWAKFNFDGTINTDGFGVSLTAVYKIG